MHPRFFFHKYKKQKKTKSYHNIIPKYSICHKTGKYQRDHKHNTVSILFVSHYHTTLSYIPDMRKARLDCQPHFIHKAGP